jgi:hypothetical protein
LKFFFKWYTHYIIHVCWFVIPTCSSRQWLLLRGPAVQKLKLHSIGVIWYKSGIIAQIFYAWLVEIVFTFTVSRCLNFCDDVCTICIACFQSRLQVAEMRQFGLEERRGCLIIHWIYGEIRLTSLKWTWSILDQALTL